MVRTCLGDKKSSKKVELLCTKYVEKEDIIMLVKRTNEKGACYRVL